MENQSAASKTEIYADVLSEKYREWDSTPVSCSSHIAAVQEIRAGSSWLKRDFNLTKQSTDSVATIFRRVLQSHKANTTSGRGDLVGRSRQRMVGSVASSGPDSTEDPPCLWS
ncbi:hypothetical protein AVEN_264900-1 [Araneus ventricosus]|uniref:Uncharacterized protein n=1 Tax=Araneus ventricosus TaxID=182803 RepID=A0A4Y2RM13_ARAVE|nr:hypothetical protein AVEN_63528-1 [Araneus ventricosus]GBN76847.1 hypothetical protein AVEN_264900-1 [Araneus ventricosus]